MAKKSDGRGAAKGLNLDNLEDMVVDLRHASESTRIAKKLRDTARLQKTRADRKEKAEKK